MALSTVVNFNATQNPPVGCVASLNDGIEATGGIGQAVTPGSAAAMSYNTLMNADQEAQVTLSYSTFQKCAVYLCASDPTDYGTAPYRLEASKVTNERDLLKIIKWNGVSDAVLASRIVPRGPYATGATIKLQKFNAGTTHVVLQAYVDGVPVVRVMDSSSPSLGLGYAGIWVAASSSGMGFEDFMVGNLGVRWCVTSAQTNPTQPQGNDANAGTFSAPYLTPRRGIRADIGMVSAGEILVIRGSSGQRLFDEFDMPAGQAWRPGTSWENSTIIASLPGETFGLTSSSATGVIGIGRYPNGLFANKYIQFFGLNQNGNGTPTTGPDQGVLLSGGSSYIRFWESDFHHNKNNGVATRQIRTAEGTDLTNHHYEFIECTIRDQQASHGAYNVSHGTLFERCDVHDNARVGIWSNTVATPTDTDILQGKGAILRWNDIHDNGEQGCAVKGFNDWWVLGNLIRSNGFAGVEVFQTSGTLANNKGPCQNPFIFNNTIYLNGQEGIAIRSGVLNGQVVNNILYKNTTKGITDSGTGTIKTNNLNPTTGTETDPLFVSESVGSEDFTLQSGSPASPCIGTGADKSAYLAVDLLSWPWPQGAAPDIGAYANPAATSPPLNPEVNVPNPISVFQNTPDFILALASLVETNDPTQEPWVFDMVVSGGTWDEV